MKKCVWFTIAITLVLFAAPMAFSSGQTEAADKQIEINMWFGRQDFIPGDAFETFHAENPNIRVNVDVIPLEQSLTEFVPAFQAGRAPDIVQTNIWNGVILANQGMVMDVSDILETWKTEDPTDFEQMSPAAWELASTNGVPYGMALHASGYHYVYRSDVLEELGLEPASTWDDVLEIGKEVSKHGYLGFSLNASRMQNPTWFQAKFMSMGASYPQGIPVLEDAAGRYALHTLQRMIAEGVSHPDSISWNNGEMRAAFLRGDAVQAVIGENIFPTIQKEMAYGEEWDFTRLPPRPGGEAERRLMANAWPYMVNAQSAEKAEAIGLVLRYLSRHEIVKEVSMRYQPTTRMTVATDPDYLAVQPWFDKLKDIATEMVSIPSHPRTTEVNQVLLDAMHEALNNPNQDVRQIARKYEQDLQAIRSGN